MRKLLFVFLITLTACSSKETIIKSEPSLDFVVTYGGSSNEVANSVTKTFDGGYAIAGFTMSNDGDLSEKSSSDADFLILKYNQNDELLWSKIYGGSDDDRADKIIETNDNGFIVLGYTKSSDGNVTTGNGDRDIWVLKLNANGELLWEKTFGYNGRDIGTSVTTTIDNGLLICGELDVTASNGEGNTNAKNQQRHAGGDFWAIKLNNNGELEWSRYFGGNFTDTPHSVIQNENGEYILAGTSDSNDVDISNNKGTYDFWVVKIDADGNLIWEKNFGGSEIDEARDIIKTNDNNYLIVGDTRSTDTDVSVNNGGADIWLIKIDTDGNLLSEKTFGGTNFDAARSLKTNNLDYLVAGSSRSNNGNFVNKGQNDAWLFSASTDNKILWEVFVGGSEIDFFYDAVQLQNGNFIAVGESTSSSDDIPENKGFSDILIAKIKK